MLKRLFLNTLLLFVALSASAVSTLDSLLNVYTSEIEQSSVYIARRQARIDSLKAIRPQTPQLQLRIAQEYQHYQSDSARAYYMRLVNAPEPLRTDAFIGLIQLFSSVGHYANAFAMLNQPDAPSIRSVEGYKTVWLLYNEAATTSLMPTSGMLEWATIATQYYDSLLIALEHDTVNPEESQLWLGLYRAHDRSDWPLALDYSRRLLSRFTPDQHRYAILAYGHAMIYEQAGEREKRREWLVRSAITDVRCGITDNGSSWIVAQDCYEAGDLNRAHLISNYTLTNASLFNAPTRYVQTYALGHTIGNEYEERLHRSYINLSITLTLLAIAILALLWGFLYLRSQNRKLSAINNQLSTANQVKEQYICRYLEVYSDYIRRLTTMARKAGEKDASTFMDREMDSFYRSFDDTFLSLYGNFVEDFNALLRPEARITPKPGERLTIEMRIFALILLGIDSSAKIAELLCYSPNTISNYRVKMKNAALGDRDAFERKVRKIGTLKD